MAELVFLPPILPTYLMPSIDPTEVNIPFEIPFTLSGIDIISTYKCEVSIRELQSNQSILKEPQLLKDIVDDNGKYIIKITSEEDLKNSQEFLRNTYYKIQLRFYYKENSETTETRSEWSSVALFKCIDTPNAQLKYLPYPVSNFIFLDVFGELSFIGEDNQIINSNEGLKSYKISLKDSNEKIVQTSGILYPEPNSKSFKYSFKMDSAAANYALLLDYETSSGYIGQVSEDISITPNMATTPFCEAEFKAKENNTAAAIQLEINNFYFTDDAPSLTDKDTIVWTIKRSSILNGFTKWEDVNIYEYPYKGNTSFSYKWTDLTVENGVWYQYIFQVTIPTQDEDGKPTTCHQFFTCERFSDDKNNYTLEGEPDIGQFFLVDFKELFLVNNYHQLKIKFNPKITSYSKKSTETVIDTIGGKYPFIRRNGTVNYKTLSLSGLISIAAEDYQEAFLSSQDSITDSYHKHEQDYQGLDLSFYKRNKYYDKYSQLYEQYNINNNINLYQDTFLETEYREKVLDYLTNSSFKLLKTPNNKNLLVKLTDVKLDPEDSLNGFLYSFSATAHQIDDSTIENYDKYNIQPIKEFKNKISYALYVAEYDNQTETSTLNSESYISDSNGEVSLVLNPVIEMAEGEDEE